MKILVIHRPYRGGGGENLAVQDFVSTALSHGIRAEHLQPEHWFRSGVERNSIQSQVRAVVREFQPDMAVVFNLFPSLSPFVLPELERGQIPWVHFLRNYRKKCIAGTEFKESGFCNLCTAARGRRLHSVNFGCYRQSSLLTAVAQIADSVESQLSKSYPPKAYFVFSQHMKNSLTGVLPEDSDIWILRNLVRRPQVAVGADRRNVVHFSGRWVPEKGSDFLLEVAQQAPSVHFEVFAPGLGKTQASSFPENVSLHLGRPRAESTAAMASAMATCVPSQFQDPSPRTLLESLSLGVPVVASKEADSTRALGFPGSGSLVLASDPAIWASALTELTDRFRDEKVSGQTEVVRKYFETYLSPEAVFPRYAQAFDAIASES